MNKKTKIAILAVIALVLVTIGITYAYWLVTKTQTNQNVVSSACLDISLSNEANDISLTNQFPISDEDGKALTPYEFTVTNNCNTSIDYHVNLEAIGDSSNALAATSLKVALNENVMILDYNESVDPTIEDAYEAYVIGKGTLAAIGNDGSTATYSLRLWIDADAPISEMNKTFTSKISVSVGQGISAQGTKLRTLILADALTNNYLYSTTPNFNTVTADGEYGLYSAEDDYGTSYYFRGDVENNYLQFGTWKETASDGVVGCYVAGNDASCVGSSFETVEACEASSDNYAWCKETKYADEGNDMYWRIIRINGDGTIRLVYDGTSAVANGTAHTAIIEKTVYNTNYDDAKYLGYTYDDGTGVQVDSTIKGIVETWYENNLESDYGKYIADSIFCNDREVTSTSGNYQYYGAYTRLNTNKSPKLTCTQDTDKYTVSSAKGNGLLKNPVGLMIADEVAFAGGVLTSGNSSYYLYTGTTYEWSMSPYHFGDSASVWYVSVGGSLTSGFVGSPSNTGARPVINLKADVKFTGDGTIDNPYKIVTE